MQETLDITKFEDFRKVTETLQKVELCGYLGSIIGRINLSATQTRPETKEQKLEVKLLFEALAKNHSIIYLEIKNINVDPSHEIIINSLAVLISKNSTLEYLFLTDSKLTDNYIKKIASALKDNQGIKKLNLRVIRRLFQI